jgi:HEAT repeats
MNIRTTGMSAAAWLLAIGMAVAAPAPDSKRMGRAKDFIADEQWGRAIVELQAAVDDPKEENRAEALFWLAHSQHQAGDDSSALQSIARLERTAPTSPWVHPARSLRIEIAQRLRLEGWLWTMATPPAPPTPAAAPVRPGAVPRPAAMTPPAQPAPPTMTMTMTTAPPPAVPMPAPPAPPPGVTAPPPRFSRPARPPVTPAPVAPPPAPWTSEVWPAPTPGWTDGTLRVQVLTGLLDAHSTQVIPLLRQIALDPNSPDEARMAVFVLAQSRVPEARRTVVEIAYDAAEPVRIAAVRELGRFDGPSISTELMRVYTMRSTPRLRHQVVSSLGERADNASLLRIVKQEAEPTVRDFAIVTLGRTGAREQLRTLYVQAPPSSRPAVLTALFTMKDDDELIRIAKTERDPALRLRARQQLGLLATPKALKFLEDNP